MDSTNKFECAFCHKIFTKQLRKHLLRYHNATLKMHTMKRLGYDSDDALPKCPFCGLPVYVDYKIHATCNSPDCRAKQTHINRSLSVSKVMLEKSAKGMHQFQSHNRKKDELGRDLIIQKQIKNGTFNQLPPNRKYDKEGHDIHNRLAALQALKSGKHHFLSKNRKYNADGKDMLASKACQTRIANLYTNVQDLNKEFFTSLVDEQGIFNVDKCMEHFHMGRRRAIVYRQLFLGKIPYSNQRQYTSFEENSVYTYLRSCLSKESLCKNYRELIKPYELDIYIPEYHLGIEYNGLYWHSSRYTNPVYHFRKNLLCAQKGIHLMQIFSNEWLDLQTQRIWKSIIKQGLYLNTSIDVTLCDVRVISTDQADNFLFENALFGTTRANYYYGLFRKNELLAALVVRHSAPRDYQIVRFCTKIGCSLNGGLERLISVFNRQHPGQISVAVDRRCDFLKPYLSAGFTPVAAMNPRYFYLTEKLDNIDWDKTPNYDQLGPDAVLPVPDDSSPKIYDAGAVLCKRM